MNKKIKSFKEVCTDCRKLQKMGKKIVFCHGFFDILHLGHINLLGEAKKLGDVLVVGVEHDDNAKIFKGPKRPVNDHDSRMLILASLVPTDYIFLIESLKGKLSNKNNFFAKGLYKKLDPDIIATSIKAGKHGKLKRKHAGEAGIQFVDIDHGIYKITTSKIIEIFGLD